MRSGNSDFTGNVGDFIALFESDLNYGFADDGLGLDIPPLRVAQMEVASTTLTVINSTNTVTLPPDFLEQRRQAAQGNRNQKLTYVTPNQMDEMLANSAGAPPDVFTIIGSALYFPTNVSTTQTLILGYYQKVPSLSSSNTVNWLVQADPMMYLAGANMKAALFLGDDDAALKWGKVVAGKVRSFGKQDRKARYSGDAMQIKTDTGNP